MPCGSPSIRGPGRRSAGGPTRVRSTPVTCSGGTGRGAIEAADEAGRFCIAVDLEAPSYPASASCLLASTHKFIDHEVEQEVLVSIDGHWSAGDKQFGIAQGAVALNLSSSPAITPDIRARLARLSSQIGQGR